MGCADTFEFRRTELVDLSGRRPDEVSDKEVADDFYYQAIDPSGVYRRYLEAAQLCKTMDVLNLHLKAFCTGTQYLATVLLPSWLSSSYLATLIKTFIKLQSKLNVKVCSALITVNP